jgi:PAS domain S-box-containing protein
MSDSAEVTAESQDLASRKNDAVIHVQQNNTARAVEIVNANEAAAELLGYTCDELIGRKIESVLGVKLAEMLAEELEFEEDRPDLGELFARQRDIRLRHRLGTEIQANCKISRLVSEGMNAQFQLLIPNDHEKLANQKMRDFIALNLEGRQELHPVTGLPTRSTVIEFIPLLQNFLAIPTGFAVIRIDRHEKNLSRYGADECVQLLQHTASCCRAGLRTEDIIFGLSDHMLGVLMFNITRESSRVLLNRLRWNIRSHRIAFGNKSDFSVTTSISFDMLEREKSEGLLERCEKALIELPIDERNVLVELGN